MCIRDREEGFVKIISPIDDTPAYKAGLKAGDLITQINNKPVMGLNLKEAVDMMRGRPGTKIIITIAREGLDLFDVELKREIIKIESVKNEIFDDISTLITSINFYDPLHQRIFAAIENLIYKGMLANPITLKNYFEKEKDDLDIPEYLVKITKFAELNIP